MKDDDRHSAGTPRILRVSVIGAVSSLAIWLLSDVIRRTLSDATQGFRMVVRVASAGLSGFAMGFLVMFVILSIAAAAHALFARRRS